MEDTESVIPPDEELRKRLFSSPSPNKRARDDEEDERGPGKQARNGRGGARSKRKPRKAGFRLSLLAVMLFLLLCAVALVVTLNPDDSWRQITWEKVQEGAIQFFSNQPLNGEKLTSQPIFGVLGALPLAVAVGITTGVFTCLFMYYDSDVPGDFPPTPVSPRKATDPSPSDSRWHLGYIFVPVNALVAFSLTLFYLRFHFGLGIL